MSNNNKIIRFGKSFLSQDLGEHGNYGAVCWDAFYDKKDPAPTVSSQLVLSDCYRKVYFEFEFSNRREYLERRKKLDTLIGVLKEYAIELDNLYEQVDTLTKWKEKECQPITLGA